MEKKYDAFISYSHDDIQLASQISRRIRTYKPPRKSGLSNKLLVFRDTERLTAASSLPDLLSEQISNSRHLVLLASPDSAKSKYVNSEIEMFLSQNDISFLRIVLLRGELENSLPAALQDLNEEPLFIDLREANSKRFKLETLRLIASLYDVDYAKLRREDEARQRKRNILSACGLMILAFFVASGYFVLTTPAEEWIKVPQPIFSTGLNGLAPVEQFAVKQSDPNTIVWLGRNARFAKEDDGSAESVEHLHFTADPEFLLFSNNKKINEELEELQEVERAGDLWYDEFLKNDDWLISVKTNVSSLNINREAVENADSIAERSTDGNMKTKTSPDEAFLKSLGSTLPVADYYYIETLTRSDLAISNIKPIWDDHETVQQPAPIHLIKVGDQPWQHIQIPVASDMLQFEINDIAQSTEIPSLLYLFTDNAGLFRSFDFGITWEDANFKEADLKKANEAKLIIASGPTLYVLALVSKEPDGDPNPLFRLHQRDWMTRLRIGLTSK